MKESTAVKWDESRAKKVHPFDLDPTLEQNNGNY